MDPFANLDNCRLDDERLCVAELAAVVEEGGRTVVDPTCNGIGRDPAALARIARATGLNVIMGGFYLQAPHPARRRTPRSGGCGFRPASIQRRDGPEAGCKQSTNAFTKLEANQRVCQQGPFSVGTRPRREETARAP